MVASLESKASLVTSPITLVSMTFLFYGATPLSQTPTERDKNFFFGFSISFVTVNGLLHGPVAVTDSLIGPYFVPNLFFSSFICFAPFTTVKMKGW
jgi:hypothetical protein